MTKSKSLHLSNPAEWWWILFGDGLRVLKKPKKRQIRPGMYDSVACSTRMCVCECGTDLSSLAVGMQPLKLMVGQLCERHLCPTCPQYTHTEACKVHWKSAPMLGLMAKPPCPVSPHTFQWIMDQDRNHFGLWVRKSIEFMGDSTPPLHSHPCRSVRLHQWVQKQHRQVYFHPNYTV